MPNNIAGPANAGKYRLAGLAMICFCSGAFFMALEILGSRILAPWFGSSVVVWGSLISVFLGASALGAASGGTLADRFPNFSTLSVIFGTAAISISVIPFTSSFLIRGLVHAFSDLRICAISVALALFALPCATFGAVTPLALRLSQPSPGTVGRTVGLFAAASTAGGILGILTIAFAGIPLFSTTLLIRFIAVGLLFLALSSALAGQRLWALSLSLVSGIACLLFFFSSPEETITVRQGLEWSPTIAKNTVAVQLPGQARWSSSSLYQKIDVWEIPSAEAGYDALRFLLLDGVPNGIAGITADGIIIDQPPLIAGFSHLIQLLPAFCPTISTVLFVGLGAGSGPMALSAQFPGLALEAVEIDAKVLDAAISWFGLDVRRIPVYIGDGRAWLASSPKLWDIIVVDAFRGGALPFHLLTLEYARIIRSHLNKNGLVVLNIPGTIDGPGNLLLQSVLRTWQIVFSNACVVAIPTIQSDGTITSPTADISARQQMRNMFLVMSGASLPLKTELAQRIINLKGNSASIMKQLLATSLQTPLVNPDGPIFVDDYAPVDLLINPFQK